MENMKNVTPPPTVANDNTWNMLCHLSAIAGYFSGIGFILGPLIVWLVKKDQIASVDAHGKESLNFHLSLFIYYIVCALLMIVVVGIPLLIALAIFNLVMIIVASIKASNGELYRYPLTIRFIK